MSMSRFFEDFGSAGPAPEASGLGAEALEEEKLKSFEAGYGAGWEDAIKAQSDAVSKATSELSQSLADLDFTFHEATGQFAGLIEPMLTQIVSKMLPRIAQQSLGSHIVEHLRDALTERVGEHLVVAVSPDNKEGLAELLASCPDLQVTVAADATLSPGKALVRLGESDKEIDLDAVVSGIDDAVTAFFHSLKEGKSNG